MPFSVPPLPYDYNALEPYIDEPTMHLHYDKHHAAYVAKLNSALEGTPWAEKNIKDVLKSLDELPEDIRTAVRNNGGGHYNHSLFWAMMKPNGEGKPKGSLADAINTDFGSFEAFQKKFTDEAVGRFASGWAWLVTKDGKLSVMSTPNQDNPIMDDPDCRVLLGLDVWEHAYYLRYMNKRPDYIAAWWKVVNWGYISERFGG